MKYASIAPIRATNDEELGKLVAHLETQSKLRRDYVVPGRDIKAVVDDDMVKFSLQMNKDLPPTIYTPTYRAHQTTWDKFDIPKQYYERMGDSAPDLLATNINYWTERSQKNYLVRTVGENVRAVLSDRFRTLDSTELFFTAFREAKDLEAKIVQADLTENNFYMKILRPDYAQKVEAFRTDVWSRKTNRPGGSLYRVLEHLEEDGGQWLVPGVSVRNSDVGSGSLAADLFVFDTICWNGLVHNRAVHQVHLGKQLDVGFISQETRDADDQVTWLKVRDLIRSALGDQDTFLALINKMQAAAETPLENAVEAVDMVVKNFGFSDEDKASIMNELLASGSNTVYGLMTAVTATGRDKENYDSGRQFEMAGGDILNNPTEFVRVKRGTKSTRVVRV